MGKITIGRRVTISHRAHLCAGTHDYKKPDLPLQKPQIHIGDQAWICADAFVGPGVVGEGAIVGATGVEVNDVQPWMFLSRIHPVKGLMNLVAAWERVRPERWRMVVAGPDEGNYLAEVETAVQRAGLERNFDFVGPVAGAAKEKLYREADLFILPTFSENFGMVVTEALSYGVPVITTKGAPWKGLVDHRCGWWLSLWLKPFGRLL